MHKGFKKEVGDEENMSDVWSGMKQITGIKMGNDSRKEAWTGIMSPPQNTQSHHHSYNVNVMKERLELEDSTGLHVLLKLSQL